MTEIPNPAPLDVKFGRVYEPDDRDRQFQMAALLPRAWPKRRRCRWAIGPILDQRRTSGCVGFAWRAWLSATPIRSSPHAPPSPEWIYQTARRLDDDPRNDNLDEGTSVRAGVQALQTLGRVKSYIWAESVDDIARWLLTHGTVVIGVGWRAGMQGLDADGYVRATGPILGGHCTHLYGVDRDTETFYLANSWSSAWGLGGTAKLTFSDMGLLLDDHGEAVTAVERAVR